MTNPLLDPNAPIATYSGNVHKAIMSHLTIQIEIASENRTVRITSIKSEQIEENVYRHKARIDSKDLNGNIFFLTKNTAFPHLHHEGLFGKDLLIMHFEGTIT